MTTTIDRTEEILDRHLDQDFFVAAAGDNAPTREQLEELAAAYRCKLPEDFLVHSTGPLAGLSVEVKEEIWPRATEFEVGPFWSFLYSVFVYGLSPEIPDWMNIELAAAEFAESTGRSLVPCLRVVGDADVYLFDDRGDIVRWNHETDELTRFGGSFFDLLDLEVARLRERKDKKVEMARDASGEKNAAVKKPAGKKAAAKKSRKK
jgi:hypothetical protein